MAMINRSYKVNNVFIGKLHRLFFNIRYTIMPLYNVEPLIILKEICGFGLYLQDSGLTYNHKKYVRKFTRGFIDSVSNKYQQPLSDFKVS